MQESSVAYSTRWIDHAFTPGLIKRSVNTALLVGTILNLINQGHTLFSDAPIVWTSVWLTYLVPYCVSTYSGAMSARQQAKTLLSEPQSPTSGPDIRD